MKKICNTSLFVTVHQQMFSTSVVPTTPISCPADVPYDLASRPFLIAVSKPSIINGIIIIIVITRKTQSAKGNRRTFTCVLRVAKQHLRPWHVKHRVRDVRYIHPITHTHTSTHAVVVYVQKKKVGRKNESAPVIS